MMGAVAVDSAPAIPSEWRGILDPDETIVWQGRPDGGLDIGPAEIFPAAFALFFAGFAVFWMVMASANGGAFWMFGLIHFSVGVGIFVNSLFGPTWRRRFTWYTLTDRRAFIATDLPLRGKALSSYPITPDSPLSAHGDRFKTIHFARERRVGDKGRSYTVNIGFERIADGDRVMALLREAQRAKETA
ncbi:MAG: aspartate carbamoyltransferase catalytic subunit [Paracoccaceae bacterium]